LWDSTDIVRLKTFPSRKSRSANGAIDRAMSVIACHSRDDLASILVAIGHITVHVTEWAVAADEWRMECTAPTSVSLDI